MAIAARNRDGSNINDMAFAVVFLVGLFCVTKQSSVPTEVSETYFD